MKLILYHGTSAENARRIEKEGFVTDKTYNWGVKSKKGFVYLSVAYAPFYALNHSSEDLALIKVEVDSDDLYPEDDFLMHYFGKAVYTQKDLDKVILKPHKHLWGASLLYLGNVAVRPEKVKLLGIRYFNGRGLIYRCDPVISSANFLVMGDYYKKLTEWIFEGKDFMQFPTFMQFFRSSDSHG